ncbi:hypothetical protein T07_15255 [Trichinella nelsoni]|uniref:Uncharacterized protein n=1 Tax=Trichinella nelsoni TaxID=6336 RepID=A0A0V0S941_9BILA|nr:hypothetical protein T07_15255 [Trichinella nelsoni]
MIVKYRKVSFVTARKLYIIQKALAVEYRNGKYSRKKIQCRWFVLVVRIYVEIWSRVGKSCKQNVLFCLKIYKKAFLTCLRERLEPTEVYSKNGNENKLLAALAAVKFQATGRGNKDLNLYINE